MKTRKGRPHGLATAVALVVLAVITVLGMGVATVGTRNMGQVHSDLAARKAVHAAEAGLAAAVREIRHDPEWSQGFPETELLYGEATYTVEATNNFSGTSTVTAPDGTAVPPGTAWVRSTGAVPRTPVRRTATSMLRRKAYSYFNYAVFADEGMHVRGNVEIDSWDSSAGTYDATMEKSGGNIGTNATEYDRADLGGVELDGQTTVWGNVSVGHGGDPAEVIKAGPRASYLGSDTLPAPNPLPMPEPPEGTSSGDVTSNSDLTLTPGHYGAVSAGDSSTLTLRSGTYVFDSLTLAGGATLALKGDGPVVLYITGTGTALDLTGGSLSNSTGIPANLQIYVGENADLAKVSGGAEAYFALYAPESQVTVSGNGEIYGSLVGKSVTVDGDVNVHYDTALRRVTSQTEWSLELVSWQRL